MSDHDVTTINIYHIDHIDRIDRIDVYFMDLGVRP